MKNSLKHIKELDGMRGIAAVAVLVFHLTMNEVPKAIIATQPIAVRAAIRIANLGALGVDVFFVLSGFLITSLLIADKNKPHFYSNFYRKRILRIGPVYLTHLLITWFLIPDSHMYVILGLVFLVNFEHQFHVAETGPAWTLSIEEQFYLIWPQIIGRLSARNIYRCSIYLILLSGGLRTYMIVVTRHAAIRNTWYRFDGLAMGALLACEWMTDKKDSTQDVRWFLKWFNSTPLLIAAIAYEGLLLAIDVPDVASALILFTTNYLVYRTIRHILYCPQSRYFQWMRSAPLRFLGSISYSMYMYHLFFMYLFDKHLKNSMFTWSVYWNRVAFVVPITILACLASMYFMERPIQGLRRYIVS